MKLWSRLTRRVGAAASTPPTLPPSRGLFIIGAARSGTTILQNALNESSEVFILGEPNLHLEVGEAGFAARYNAMHRSWANQETKSTFCPPILSSDGTSDDYLDRLSASYDWVGSKIVVNSRRDAEWLDRFKAYHCNRFYTARYIFTFREPLAVVRSTRDLQVLTGAEIDTVSALLVNYLEVVILFVWALRNLKHACAVFHDDMGEETMAKIGLWLDLNLTTAAGYYETSRVRVYQDNELDPAEQKIVQQVAHIYADLREAVRAGFTKLQLEQNDNNFSAGHYTPIGALARRAKTIRDALSAG